MECREATIEEIKKAYWEENYKDWDGIEKDFEECLTFYTEKNEKPFFLKRKGCVTFNKDYIYKNNKYILFISIPCIELLDGTVELDAYYISKYSINIDVFKG
jgi:hypothetical protein